MRTPSEVLKKYQDLGNYWAKEIKRRHEMQLPRPHDALEIRSILYGEAIAELRYALNETIEELEEIKNRDFCWCSYCGYEVPINAEDGLEQVRAHVLSCEEHPMYALKQELEEYKEGLEIERQWKREAYDRNDILKRRLEIAELKQEGPIGDWISLSQHMEKMIGLAGLVALLENEISELKRGAIE